LSGDAILHLTVMNGHHHDDDHVILTAATVRAGVAVAEGRAG
jgi:hypothetical protein